MAAAVADHRPAVASEEKIKKNEERTTLELVRNPDLLGEIGAARGGKKRPVLVGFAVETGGAPALVAYARRKLVEKDVDLIVANAAASSFAKDDNEAILVTRGEEEPIPPSHKLLLADRILDRARALSESGR
jgi:phosphopantothenoylcysteine decarboxylase/phosphopantothenate--cysteine ligase